jgi:two-component system cell cycle response regulator
MEAAVLLIGCAPFICEFTERYSPLVTETREAFSVEDAVTAISQHQPDIILLQGDLAIAKRLIYQPACEGIYCVIVEGLSKPLSPLEQQQRQLYWIEGGIDVYLPLAGFNTATEAQLALEVKLLKAYIREGTKRTRRYRDLQQTNDVLSTIALADQLTELGNRRALDWELLRQIKNARRYQTPLSTIMLDVDYFKSVNDTYGHLVGDRVLKLLAARLRDRLRIPDSIFRYGGEEFAILLQHTSLEAAALVAERLRQIIQEQPFHINRDLTLPITVSLGLATLLPSDDDSGQSLIGRADANLLKAKAAGRNCTISG